MATYEVWLLSDRGERLALLEEWEKLEYLLGRDGWFSLDTRLPDLDLLAPDRLVTIYRRPGFNEGRLQHHPGLEMVYFLRRWKVETDGDYRTTVHLAGPSLDDLMRRRIVAYFADSLQAFKNDLPADDVLRALARENLGDLAGTDYAGDPVTGRDLSALGFTVQPDRSLAPALTKGYSWQKLDEALLDTAEVAYATGTTLYYGFVPLAIGLYEFQVWPGQPGRDRAWGSGNPPLLFGLEYGNMAGPTLEEDWSKEENYVYGGGQGEDNVRVIQEVGDPGRTQASAWNRAEAFSGSRSGSSTPLSVQNDARVRLSQNRPRVRFTAEILDTPETPYGGLNGWQYGDRVSAYYLQRRYDCVVEAVHVTVDAEGQDRVKARLEYQA